MNHSISVYVFNILLLCSTPLFARTFNIVVASQNAQKISAVQQAFAERFCNDTIELIACKSSSAIPEQPIGYQIALTGARNRIASTSDTLHAEADYVVAIENYIEKSAREDYWNDIGLVLIKDMRTSHETITLSQPVLIPNEYIEIAQEQSGANGISADGFSVTVGNVISKSLLPRTIDPHDWHREPEFGGVSRQQLLQEALFKSLHTADIDLLKSHIIYYPDFPKPGIIFADFLPILKDARALETCINLLAERYKNHQIDIVVGLESRGFILGAALAHKLGIGFVPVRKPGKLPGPTYSVTYKKEYGTDTLVIAQNALQSGQRVLIIDDLIATGGSARAAIELVALAGGTPVEFVTLLHVPQLVDYAHLSIPSFNLID